MFYSGENLDPSDYVYVHPRDQYIQDNYVHKDDLPDLEEMKAAFQDIVKFIYGKEDLDIAKLDDQMAWMAEQFRFKMPHGQPNILRKKQEPYLFNLALYSLGQNAI